MKTKIRHESEETCCGQISSESDYWGTEVNDVRDRPRPSKLITGAIILAGVLTAVFLHCKGATL